MKRHFLAIIVAVSLCPLRAHALIKTNENATDELGEFASTTSDTTLNWTQGAANNNAGSVNALGLSIPGNSAIDLVNHRLFVVDSGNNRVLVYTLNTDNSISTASGGHTAQYVLGQPNLTSGAANEGGSGPTQSSLSQPDDVAFDAANNRLFVADTANSRVLVFNTSTVTNGMNASYELGQPSGSNAFTSSVFNATQWSIAEPSGLAYDAANARLFVTDLAYSRVMIFNVATGSIANGENASNILGHASYTATGSGHTASTLYYPQGLAYDPVFSRLFVADTQNNRVMIFNVAPGSIANGESASNVLGTSSLTTTGNGNCTASTFTEPIGVAYDPNPSHNTLFVGDFDNSVVHAFNATPAYLTNGMSATYQLGSCGSYNTTQNSFFFVGYLMYDPGSSRLFVDDVYNSGAAEGNNRIMIFDGGILPAWTPGYD
jgi:DNA-binding beta-propeller fold protein YncE